MRISDWSSDVCSSDLRRRDHVAGDVDAADQRESTQDPALAGAGQRVLEIDGRVRASDHDLAGRQVVQRDPLDAAAVAGLVAVDAEGLEGFRDRHGSRSEEHTSELQSIMRISYDAVCIKQKTITITHQD